MAYPKSVILLVLAALSSSIAFAPCAVVSYRMKEGGREYIDVDGEIDARDHKELREFWHRGCTHEVAGSHVHCVLRWEIAVFSNASKQGVTISFDEGESLK